MQHELWIFCDSFGRDMFTQSQRVRVSRQVLGSAGEVVDLVDDQVVPAALVETGAYGNSTVLGSSGYHTKVLVDLPEAAPGSRWVATAN